MTAIRSPSSQLYLAAACFAAAAFFMNSSAMLFDDRLFNGAAIWDKPLKFWASIGIHFATLGLLLPLAPEASQKGLLTRSVAAVCVIAGLFETFYITTQAARGRASHFSTGTALEVHLYHLMGVGAVLLVVASFVLGSQICRSRKPWTGVRWGAALGLIMGSVLTLLTAGFMSGQPSHYFGIALGAASDGNGLPLVGWSLSLPDLRPPHFVATHMMQALPIVGLFADRFAPQHGKALVFGSAVVAILLVAGLFVRAVTM
jgi:hypothetical protein